MNHTLTLLHPECPKLALSAIGLIWARKFRIFLLLNQKLLAQLHTKTCILSMKSCAWLVQILEQPVMYRPLLNIPYMGIYLLLRRNIWENLSDQPMIAKASFTNNLHLASEKLCSSNNNKLKYLFRPSLKVKTLWSWLLKCENKVLIRIFMQIKQMSHSRYVCVWYASTRYIFLTYSYLKYFNVIFFVSLFILFYELCWFY